MNTFRRLSVAVSTAALSFAAALPAYAQRFGGPVPALPGTPTGVDVRGTITQVLEYILSFLALAAVIVIVIAGIRLIVSQGEEEAKNKAKSTIFYALIGLIIVLFARVIVGLVTQELPKFVQ